MLRRVKEAIEMCQGTGVFCKTVKDIIAELQNLPPDMEVWSFDYGDSQPYEITTVELQKDAEADDDHKVGHDVVMIC